MLTLDVVTKDLAVTLGSSLSKSLSSLAAAQTWLLAVCSDCWLFKFEQCAASC